MYHCGEKKQEEAPKRRRGSGDESWPGDFGSGSRPEEGSVAPADAAAGDRKLAQTVVDRIHPRERVRRGASHAGVDVEALELPHAAAPERHAAQALVERFDIEPPGAT